MLGIDKIWVTAKIVAIVIFLIGCFVVVAPVAAKFIGFLDKKEQLYNEQMIRLSSNVVSQRMEINNKLLQEQIKGLNEQVLALAKSRDQEIVAVGKIVAELKQDFKEQIGFVYKDAQDSSKDYIDAVIKKKLEDGSEIPWGWAMYSPNVPDEEKWTTGTYPLKFHTEIALGENPDRSDAYIEAWMTSDTFKKDKGKKFPVNIESVSWVKKPPKEKSFMFNPRLSLGINIASRPYPALEFSFFSYGRTKGDMDFRFLGFGIGGDNDHRYMHVAPVEYNIGKPIPFMENLFISPFIGLDEDSDLVWGVGLQLPF